MNLIRIAIFLLTKAWFYLCAGLAILGWVGYTHYNVSRGGDIPPLESLTEVHAHVDKTHRVIQETRRRRAGTSRSAVYYELYVVLENGEPQTWRAPLDISQGSIKRLEGQDVIAHVDQLDNNMVYQVVRNGVVTIKYQDLANAAMARAQRSRGNAMQPAVWGSGIALTLIGIVWMVVQRRRRIKFASDSDFTNLPGQGPAPGQM